MNQDNDNQPVVEQESAVNTSSLLIDNDTGEPAELHPLTTNDTGADDSDAVDVTESGDQAEQTESLDSQEESEGKVEEVKTQPVQPQAPEQIQRVEDPGEFQPKDYSFDVTLADGTTVRFSSPEDIDKLPETPEFATVKDHTQFITNYSKMANGIEADKRAYDEQKKQYEQQTEYDNEFENSLKTLTSEFTYLESTGELPDIPAQYKDADWSDPEVAKQPGVKERIDLLIFREEENKKRFQAGLPGVGILEAKTLMENKALKEEQLQKRQKQNELRKQRGAMVGGNSAPAPAPGSNDMIVGSGGTLRDLGY